MERTPQTTPAIAGITNNRLGQDFSKQVNEKRYVRQRFSFAGSGYTTQEGDMRVPAIC